MSKIWYGLEDKVVLVTGGSRGIGFTLARELLDQKAKVVICARKKEGLDQAVAELGVEEDLMAVMAHIAKEDQVDNLFDMAMNRFGRVDVLVNNVGMNLMTQSVVEADYETWKKIVDSNLNGTYLCASRAAQIMKELGGGKIVNLSSIAGQRATPAMGIYGIAKSGVEMLTRVLAMELAPYNIQVNAVAPAMVKTDFSKPFWSDPNTYQEIVKNIPMQRIAEPYEVASTVLFLASEAASFITGQTVVIDGGSTAV